MSKSTALDTLIELAATATDEAARKLGLAIRASDDAAQKLALLTQYRDEYCARFQAGMAKGLSASEYRNYRQFVDKIEQAITGQTDAVRLSKERVSRERSAWQDSERKRLSYDALANRAKQDELMRAAKREQKENDEYAARSASTRR